MTSEDENLIRKAFPAVWLAKKSDPLVEECKAAQKKIKVLCVKHGLDCTIRANQDPYIKEAKPAKEVNLG